MKHDSNRTASPETALEPRALTPEERKANPGGLGITHCDACGAPATVVGPLGDPGSGRGRDARGKCRYCTHDLDRYEVLADELERLVGSWVAACRARDVIDRDICEVFDMVEYRVGLHGAPEMEVSP